MSEPLHLPSSVHSQIGSCGVKETAEHSCSSSASSCNFSETSHVLLFDSTELSLGGAEMVVEPSNETIMNINGNSSGTKKMEINSYSDGPVLSTSNQEGVFSSNRGGVLSRDFQTKTQSIEKRRQSMPYKKKKSESSRPGGQNRRSISPIRIVSSISKKLSRNNKKNKNPSPSTKEVDCADNKLLTRSDEKRRRRNSDKIREITEDVQMLSQPYFADQLSMVGDQHESSDKENMENRSNRSGTTKEKGRKKDRRRSSFGNMSIGPFFGKRRSRNQSSKLEDKEEECFKKTSIIYTNDVSKEYNSQRISKSETSSPNDDATKDDNSQLISESETSSLNDDATKDDNSQLISKRGTLSSFGSSYSEERREIESMINDNEEECVEDRRGEIHKDKYSILSIFEGNVRGLEVRNHKNSKDDNCNQLTLDSIEEGNNVSILPAPKCNDIYDIRESKVSIQAPLREHDCASLITSENTKIAGKLKRFRHPPRRPKKKLSASSVDDSSDDDDEDLFCEHDQFQSSADWWKVCYGEPELAVESTKQSSGTICGATPEPSTGLGSVPIGGWSASRKPPVKSCLSSRNNQKARSQTLLTPTHEKLHQKLSVKAATLDISMSTPLSFHQMSNKEVGEDAVKLITKNDGNENQISALHNIIPTTPSSIQNESFPTCEGDVESASSCSMMETTPLQDKHVKFGIVKAAEFHLDRPTHELTPLPLDVTMERYSVEEKEKKKQLEEKGQSKETISNSATLAVWDESFDEDDDDEIEENDDIASLLGLMDDEEGDEKSTENDFYLNCRQSLEMELSPSSDESPTPFAQKNRKHRDSLAAQHKKGRKKRQKQKTCKDSRRSSSFYSQGGGSLLCDSDDEEDLAESSNEAPMSGAHNDAEELENAKSIICPARISDSEGQTSDAPSSLSEDDRTPFSASNGCNRVRSYFSLSSGSSKATEDSNVSYNKKKLCCSPLANGSIDTLPADIVGSDPLHGVHSSGARSSPTIGDDDNEDRSHTSLSPCALVLNVQDNENEPFDRSMSLDIGLKLDAESDSSSALFSKENIKEIIADPAFDCCSEELETNISRAVSQTSRVLQFSKPNDLSQSQSEQVWCMMMMKAGVDNPIPTRENISSTSLKEKKRPQSLFLSATTAANNAISCENCVSLLKLRSEVSYFLADFISKSYENMPSWANSSSNPRLFDRFLFGGNSFVKSPTMRDLEAFARDVVTLALNEWQNKEIQAVDELNDIIGTMKGDFNLAEEALITCAQNFDTFAESIPISDQSNLKKKKRKSKLKQLRERIKREINENESIKYQLKFHLSNLENSKLQCEVLEARRMLQIQATDVETAAVTTIGSQQRSILTHHLESFSTKTLEVNQIQILLPGPCLVNYDIPHSDDNCAYDNSIGPPSVHRLMAPDKNTEHTTHLKMLFNDVERHSTAAKLRDALLQSDGQNSLRFFSLTGIEASPCAALPDSIYTASFLLYRAYLLIKDVATVEKKHKVSFIFLKENKPSSCHDFCQIMLRVDMKIASDWKTNVSLQKMSNLTFTLVYEYNDLFSLNFFPVKFYVDINNKSEGFYQNITADLEEEVKNVIYRRLGCNIDLISTICEIIGDRCGLGKDLKS